MSKYTFHGPSKVTVSYGNDWTPLVLAAVVIAALAYAASLILSFLAVIAGAVIAVAVISVAWLVLVLHRDGLWVGRRHVPAAQSRAVRAVIVPSLPARQPEAIENRAPVPAQWVITDAVPQQRKQS